MKASALFVGQRVKFTMSQAGYKPVTHFGTVEVMTNSNFGVRWDHMPDDVMPYSLATAFHFQPVNVTDSVKRGNPS